MPKISPETTHDMFLHCRLPKRLTTPTDHLCAACTVGGRDYVFWRLDTVRLPRQTGVGVWDHSAGAADKRKPDFEMALEWDDDYDLREIAKHIGYGLTAAAEPKVKG